MAEKPKVSAKVAQSAPILPTTGDVSKVKGVVSPVSAPTIPSVYNKKLNKLFRGRLLVLPGENTVEDTLRRMGRYNISAVPVTQSKKDSTILGFVGVLDILAHLCKLVAKEEGGAQKIEIGQDLGNKIQEFKSTPIYKLVDTSGRNPFHLINGEESLADVVEQYLKGVQRIAITDDEGNVTGVVSQWTIANYLATVPTDDKEWIPMLMANVGEVTYTKDVKTVNLNENTLNAFYKMYINNISAIAVVDDNGKLWGNLSASDLRGYQMFLDDFNELTQPVSHFLTSIRKQQGRKANFVVAGTPDTKVKDLVTKFNEEIVHRAYIVDKEQNLIGTFSLTDLMKDLVSDTHTIAAFAKPTARPREQ